MKPRQEENVTLLNPLHISRCMQSDCLISFGQFEGDLVGRGPGGSYILIGRPDGGNDHCSGPRGGRGHAPLPQTDS